MAKKIKGGISWDIKNKNGKDWPPMFTEYIKNTYQNQKKEGETEKEFWSRREMEIEAYNKETDE